MLKKSLAVSFVGLGLAMVGGGSASAAVSAGPSNGVDGSAVAVAGDQGGVLTVAAPVAGARCAAPLYGGAFVGGSTPMGQQSVACDDADSPV